jgi:hypothetical protein
MWLCEDDLRRFGFRRQSYALWICERGYGLTDQAHLSAFTWSDRQGCELESFHLTRPLGREVVHFYYREEGCNVWAPEGYTPARDLLRLGGDPRTLRESADAVAQRLVRALGGWTPR